MSKWRPTEKGCTYIIPDIHGNKKNLLSILYRILPLRNTNGIKDNIIFLGDYIDRGNDVPDLIDLLISLKEEYPEQCVFLKGNHEEMMLIALGYGKTPKKRSPIIMNAHFKVWKENGGEETILSYLHKANIYDALPHTASIERVKNCVPENHIEFMDSCVNYHETDDAIFVHGGMIVGIPMKDQLPNVLYWDRVLVNFVKDCKAKNKLNELNWKKPIICGHSGPVPIILQNYMMLDAGAPNNLMVMELNSRQAYLAVTNKKKLIKYEY